MGTHVCPWLFHVDVWQKPPHYYKVISLQLNELIKNSQWEFAVLLMELKLGLCDSLNMWGRVGGEKETQERGHMYTYN